MMRKYIDANKLEKDGWNLHRIRPKTSSTMVYETKKPTDFPAADVQEVQHGRWNWVDGVRCSICNYKLQTTGLPSYCPNCGAQMDKEYDYVSEFNGIE